MLLDNGNNSLLPSSQTHIRQKSSVLCDFPTGREPMSGLQKKVRISGKKGGDVRKSGRDRREEDGGILPEKSGCHHRPAFPNGVELAASAASSFAKRVKVEDEYEDLVEVPVLNVEPTVLNNTVTLGPQEPADVIKTEVVDEGTSVHPYLAPHHPTLPNVVRKEHRCPSQKRVSTARDFSASYARKVSKLSETDSNIGKAVNLNDVDGKCKDGLEDPCKLRENVCEHAIKQAPLLKKTSQMSRQEEKFEDNNDKEGKRVKLSENSVKETTFRRKYNKKKKKLNGVTSSNVEFFENNIACVGNERSEPGNEKNCSLDKTDVRREVRDTLRLFHGVLRKLMQATEKEKEGRTDASLQLIAAAKILKDHGKYINTKKIVGTVPGLEVGDIFNYRLELGIVGLHRQLQSGIDFVTFDGKMIAISVVASGRYDNIMNNSDVLIYSGQGGNVAGGCKHLEDQKLERGNLALKNSIDIKNKVRVIRGFKDRKQINWIRTTTPTYIYDGLYTVESYWPDLGPNGKWSFKFELRRVPHQPELTWKKVKLSKKTRAREGRHVDDISNGKEKNPICAVNTIDDGKPLPFTYITEVMCPDWCRPLPPKGCDCRDGCSNSKLCACAHKNGGEIPYNYSGTLVEEKPLVYECGPSCNCPPTCHNRVSQHGIKLPFEIFKTESRGWGLRCLSSIPIGNFVCEYIGELLDDNEAEQRIDNDDYLFDIGANYNDSTLRDGLSALMPDMPSSGSDQVENVGFTLDARMYANVGRFINHSCSPNLLAQNVLYDHDDKRIPHIMFFAMENIPPLQELTYHYNYTIDQVIDNKGSIKQKSCHCGSTNCRGRMY